MAEGLCTGRVVVITKTALMAHSGSHPFRYAQFFGETGKGTVFELGRPTTIMRPARSSRRSQLCTRKRSGFYPTQCGTSAKVRASMRFV